MANEDSFREFFVRTTGIEKGPYPYQVRLACEGPTVPQLLDVPTGLGKTAAVVLAWLWRRRFADEEIRKQTPRRLVYCLPMRVLVEQTYSAAQSWLDNLAKAGCLPKVPRVHLLMGGEEASDWDLYPEQDAVLIGTQDMLLSRVLNRGYGMSRFRWPVHFGLLNNDCLWVFDEVQLMDAGVATSAQVEAFRRMMGTSSGVQCLWMSATLAPTWLHTVDFDSSWLGEPFPFLEEDRKSVQERLQAPKRLQRAFVPMGDAAGAAKVIAEKHQAGTRTLAVFNTVGRAVEVFTALQECHPSAKTVLIHSRFRQPDRDRKLQQLLAAPPAEGIIAVTTQVVEAGVDVSAKALFTEVAPWPSLVQRFGRCNRAGEFADDDPGRVFWFNLPEDPVEREKLVNPYGLEDLEQASKQLESLSDVSPLSLSRIGVEMNLEAPHVIRRRDFIDLFDTTPDLAGNDIDVSRFIRSGMDFDVHVCWRVWDQPKGNESPPTSKHWRRIAREEICSVPVGEFRKFATNAKRRGKIWRWNVLDGEWVQPDASAIYPGQTYVLHCDVGGYDPERGWMGDRSKEKVQPLETGDSAGLSSDDAYDDDTLSALLKWQTLAEHTENVLQELDAILSALPLDDKTKSILKTAARWHDRGKAHHVFQASLPEDIPDPTKIWAKAAGTWKPYARRHFRHELASALAMLAHEMDDLAIYIVAAHHGKVRLSIRSLPGENPPEDDPTRLYARGIWDGDELPEADLGGGVVAPPVRLSLECMQLGRSTDGQPSWAERMLKLRDDSQLGPFRLAYLEAVLRAADMRASRLDAQPRANLSETIA